MRLRTIVISCVFGLLAVSAQAQTYTPLLMPRAQFFDANGDPLAGGKVCTYAAGTSTPLATYTDSTGGTPNSTTITLDSGGFANIWLGPNPYKIVVAASDCASPLWTVDNVSGTTTTNVVCSSACISDAEIDATGITTRTKLPAELAYEDEGNTWTTGAQSFSAATSLTLPVAAGAAPTANGRIHYDSTANQLEYGDNGTNRVFVNTDEAQTISGKTFSDNLTWTSGTAFDGIFDHANTASRTYTLPDSSVTLVGRSNAETISGVKTFSALPIMSGFTAGSLLFCGTSCAVAEDNSNLFFDDTNNTLGVGTTRSGAISGTNPRAMVKGSGATSATSSFQVQNSAANSILFVRDDQRVGINTNAPGAELDLNGSMAIASGGVLTWGGDTNLYRAFNNILATDDNLIIGNTASNTAYLQLQSKSAASTDIIYAGVQGDATERFLVEADGKLSWGSGAAVEDTTLYRNAANVLKTDDAFTYLLHYPGSIVTFSSSDTTPSVSGSNVFKTNNGVGTTITTFDDGATGQQITIIFADTNTTVAETSNIKLSAAFTSTADDTMTLVYDGTNWYETARAVN